MKVLLVRARCQAFRVPAVPYPTRARAALIPAPDQREMLQPGPPRYVSVKRDRPTASSSCESARSVARPRSVREPPPALAPAVAGPLRVNRLLRRWHSRESCDAVPTRLRVRSTARELALGHRRLWRDVLRARRCGQRLRLRVLRSAQVLRRTDLPERLLRESVRRAYIPFGCPPCARRPSDRRLRLARRSAWRAQPARRPSATCGWRGLRGGVYAVRRGERRNAPP